MNGISSIHVIPLHWRTVTAKTDKTHCLSVYKACFTNKAIKKVKRYISILKLDVAQLYPSGGVRFTSKRAAVLQSVLSHTISILYLHILMYLAKEGIVTFCGVLKFMNGMIHDSQWILKRLFLPNLRVVSWLNLQ